MKRPLLNSVKNYLDDIIYWITIDNFPKSHLIIDIFLIVSQEMALPFS